jgi:hypothetical protein
MFDLATAIVFIFSFSFSSTSILFFCSLFISWVISFLFSIIFLTFSFLPKIQFF